MSLNLKYVFRRKHIVELCFVIPSNNICILNGLFNLFTFILLQYMVVFRSAILLLVFYMLHTSLLPGLYSWLYHRFFLCQDTLGSVPILSFLLLPFLPLAASSLDIRMESHLHPIEGRIFVWYGSCHFIQRNSHTMFSILSLQYIFLFNSLNNPMR